MNTPLIQTARFQLLNPDGRIWTVSWYHILVPESIMHQFTHPNLFGQPCLLPTHTFQTKSWFRGAKSPGENSTKPLKSRTRDHQKAQGQQQSARGHYGLNGQPLFSRAKKRAAGPRSHEAGSNEICLGSG